MEYLRKIDKATSVKEISIIKEPTANSPGIADFRYRPVFSVFDFGTIIPPIPLDNSTVNLMMGFNFELLEGHGIESHYLGLVNEEGTAISARDAIFQGKPLTTARVKFVNRLMPKFEKEKWNYSMFQSPKVNNYVLPIEFISRNELPESSSVWRRMKKGELTLWDLGLPRSFKQGNKIPKSLSPILDYSTKFEPDDRYLNNQEVKDILGISETRLAKINENTKKTSQIMTDYAESRGFQRLDGKVEYITFYLEKEPKISGKRNDIFVTLSKKDRRIRDVLGDAVCTWHEDRLITPPGLGISKQLIRDEVKRLNNEWYDDIQNAKEMAKTRGIEDFRTLLNENIKYVSPSKKFFESINNLFRAGTNQWIDYKFYDGYPGKNYSVKETLEKAVEDFQNISK